MLKENMIQEIQELKLRGFTPAEISEYISNHREKAPSMPTIRKYYNMPVVQDTQKSSLVKPKVFDIDPFRSYIVNVLNRNLDNDYFTVSSLYDVLEEHFVESGEFEKLPGNQQTLRNYTAFLRESGAVSKEPDGSRVYDHVFDTPPGDQMLIDFGEIGIRKGLRIHFICLLLRYSRYLVVYAQDHKFNAVEACQAIYRAFCRIGGRPVTLVIDQDAVFVSEETYGEVIKTQVFEDFCTEQGLKLWTCRKADPESKGPVENSVGFVKKNYFSARLADIGSIEDVWCSLPKWMDRKNKRIHQTTFCMPVDILEKFERAALRPLIPSFYESYSNNLIPCKISSYPFIKYRTNKYSVPQDFTNKTIFYKIVGNSMHIYNEQQVFNCTHTLSELKGQTIQLEEHKPAQPTAWLKVIEDMRSRWGGIYFQPFINGVQNNNPRYLLEQFRHINELFTNNNVDRAAASVIMKICCKEELFSYSKVKNVVDGLITGKIVENDYTPTEVQTKELSVYQKAFEQRTATFVGAGS